MEKRHFIVKQERKGCILNLKDELWLEHLLVTTSTHNNNPLLNDNTKTKIEQKTDEYFTDENRHLYRKSYIDMYYDEI